MSKRDISFCAIELPAKNKQQGTKFEPRRSHPFTHGSYTDTEVIHLNGTYISNICNIQAKQLLTQSGPPAKNQNDVC